MGREQPTIVLRPNQNRRDERARRARETKNRVIPDLLRSCPRAKHGIARAELIVDPSPVAESSSHHTPADSCSRPDLKIRVQPLDTLTAASRIADKSLIPKRSGPAVKSRSNAPNIGVLNMCSALRPGGGFLEGANSQEEFLCARTTLYPSLWDSFYRLPDVSGIYTPDVLVFRDHLPEANDLSKNSRFFIDVISSSMFRFSDARAEGCSCSLSYCDKHRDLSLRSMRAVLRIAQSKGAEKLVLGAWGCGSHGNPVKEVAKNWRKVIAGAPRQKRPNAERWEGIDEIIFAIPDRTMLREFEAAFQDILAPDDPESSEISPVDSVAQLDEEHARTSELLSRIAEIEMQIEQAKNPRLKNRLRETLANLQRDLNQGPNAKASNAEDVTPEEDDPADGFVFTGFPASDDEDNGFYHLADRDMDSDSSGRGQSENYEFRPGPPGLASHDEDESLDEALFPAISHSPKFDAETGWYSGSLDGLTTLLKQSQGGMRHSRTSPGSPEIRPTSGDLGINSGALHEYLSRYQGTDVADY
ncbi:hypothetical protein BDY17DRAFT_291090 [Neohortaea acidophila]|uniref:Microbial-type PARG catalytic domain-containing protein n=1 Tax=Neohortaea acidophila TaxID=245834 RepID=A0A6A6Q2G8_9PEZI|nr:uncharacterized protein BDY17DRAFT_291090 [Neohortaea acidophila]KAF2486221.1 hypothetical protein BDY17DRAFT_291090 [Neohortaea acidophila]